MLQHYHINVQATCSHPINFVYFFLDIKQKLDPNTNLPRFFKLFKTHCFVRLNSKGVFGKQSSNIFTLYFTNGTTKYESPK